MGEKSKDRNAKQAHCEAAQELTLEQRLPGFQRGSPSAASRTAVK